MEGLEFKVWKKVNVERHAYGNGWSLHQE
jgi:hypothetical protein